MEKERGEEKTRSANARHPICSLITILSYHRALDKVRSLRLAPDREEMGLLCEMLDRSLKLAAKRLLRM